MIGAAMWKRSIHSAKPRRDTEPGPRSRVASSSLGQEATERTVVEREESPSRNRSIRCEDSLWEEGQAACKLRGDPSLSYVLRRYLEHYIRETPRVLAARRKRDEEAGLPLI